MREKDKYSKNEASVDILSASFVYFVMFILGGAVSYFALPEFWGRFFIGGIIFATFATFSAIYLNSKVFGNNI